MATQDIKALEVCFNPPLNRDLWAQVSQQLFAWGCLGIYEGEESSEYLEEVSEFSEALETYQWPEPEKVFIYFEADAPRLNDAITFIEATLQGRGSLKITIQEKRDDFAEFKKSFQPINIGQHWCIYAPWHEIPLTAKPSNHEPTLKQSLILEPGMAFGTGSHETTQMCLELLTQSILDQASESERGRHPSELRILDMGCGSGILGIAALIMGAQQVVGCDLDELALKASEDNARLNQKQWHQLTKNLSDLPETTSTSSFHIIVANLLKNPLLSLQEIFKQKLSPDWNRLIISGLLKSQWEEVHRRYSPSFLLVSKCEQGDWVAAEYKLLDVR